MMNSTISAFFRLWARWSQVIVFTGVFLLGFAMATLVYHQKTNGVEILPYSAALCQGQCAEIDESILDSLIVSARSSGENACALPNTIAEKYAFNSESSDLLATIFSDFPITIDIQNEARQLRVELENEIPFSLFGWASLQNTKYCIAPTFSDPGKLFLVLLMMWGAVNFGIRRAFKHER